MSTQDDAQAVEYRRMMRARATNKARLEASLVGSADAKRRVDLAWEPIINRDRTWSAPSELDDD